MIYLYIYQWINFLATIQIGLELVTKRSYLTRPLKQQVVVTTGNYRPCTRFVLIFVSYCYVTNASTLRQMDTLLVLCHSQVTTHKVQVVRRRFVCVSLTSVASISSIWTVGHILRSTPTDGHRFRAYGLPLVVTHPSTGRCRRALTSVLSTSTRVLYG